MMDSEYLAVEHSGPAYAPALTLLSSVISANHCGSATIDAGTKSVYVTPGAPAQVIRNGKIDSNFVYSWDFGDEHGHLTFPAETTLKPGDLVEMIVSHCDPTVNLFDEINVVRNGNVIDRWKISLRGCCR
jgi:D-serine deaminase-like pyridoxal phosphate-dependent protein